MKTVYVNFDNPSFSNKGIFEGWGTSLCWWANRVGYSPVLTKKSSELFFSSDGLNLNIMRYNIGGGDNPTHTHIKRTDSVVPGYLYFDENTKKYSYNYNADINQLNILKACYEINEHPIVEVFSNSPPYFMTVSGCSSGGQKPNENNLRDDCVDFFAEYLVHVTDYIHNKLNIKVTSLSPMNEPNTDYWHYLSEKQEGCHFDCGESQNKLLLSVYDAMKKYGLTDILLTASDETSTDKALHSYKSYSKEVKKCLGRINTHTYGTGKMKKLAMCLKEERINLWMSESDWDGVSGENAGEMGAGLWLAQKIIKDINTLSPSAWVLWQTIDYHKSANGYIGNKDFGIPDTTKGFWGVAFADHDAEEIILTQKYYCFGQFTRYINPGDIIYHVNENVLCAANEKEIKLVAVNTNSDEKPFKIDFTGIKRILKSVRATRTSGNMQNGEHWAELPTQQINENIFNTHLKGNSVTTFIFI